LENGTSSNGTQNGGLPNGTQVHPAPVQRSSSVASLGPVSKPTLPAPLSKAKSSTFLSPDLPPTMYNSRVTLTLRRSHSRLQQLEGSSNGNGLQRSDSLRAGSEGEEAEGSNGLPKYHFGAEERPRPPLPGAKPRLQHSVCPLTTFLDPHPTQPGLALLYYSPRLSPTDPTNPSVV